MGYFISFQECKREAVKCFDSGNLYAGALLITQNQKFVSGLGWAPWILDWAKRVIDGSIVPENKGVDVGKALREGDLFEAIYKEPTTRKRALSRKRANAR